MPGRCVCRLLELPTPRIPRSADSRRAFWYVVSLKFEAQLLSFETREACAAQLLSRPTYPMRISRAPAHARYKVGDEASADCTETDSSSRFDACMASQVVLYVLSEDVPLAGARGGSVRNSVACRTAGRTAGPQQRCTKPARKAHDTRNVNARYAPIGHEQRETKTGAHNNNSSKQGVRGQNEGWSFGRFLRTVLFFNRPQDVAQGAMEAARQPLAALSPDKVRCCIDWCLAVTKYNIAHMLPRNCKCLSTHLHHMQVCSCCQCLHKATHISLSGAGAKAT